MIELVAGPTLPDQPLLVETFAIAGAGSASPVIDRVPFELWQQIFLLLLSSEDVPGLDEIFGPIWGRTTPPASIHGKLILPQSSTTISQVCSSWREYAFGMPDLWTMLFVKAPAKKLSSSASKLAVLVERRLVLTRSMPLKLCVYSKDDEESTHTLLGAILPFSSRWETIHLHIPPTSMSGLFSLRQSDLPLLTSFKIHMQIYALGTIKSRQLSVFDNVPPIQRLCTSYLPPPTCPIYAALEELHIQEGRSETWATLRVLAACPQLRVLTLSGVGITMASAAPSAVYPDLVLTELHTLNLEHPTGRERLLEVLKLPKLRALTIGGSCSGESTSSVFSAIMMLMDRSELDSLQSLTIYFERHTSEPALLISFLCRNPFLKELIIDDTWKFLNHRPLVTSSLLEALTCLNRCRPSSKAYICPELERIQLIGCSEFEDEVMLAFLKSRCRLGRPTISSSDAECQSLFKGSSCRSPATLKGVHISMKKKIGGSLFEIVESWKAMGYPIDLHRF